VALLAGAQRVMAWVIRPRLDTGRDREPSEVPAAAFTVSGTKHMPSEIAGPVDRGKTGHPNNESAVAGGINEKYRPPAVDMSKRITALSSRLGDYRTTVPPNAFAKAWASPSSSKSTRKTVAVPSSE
jgi:hypothetical protein